MTYYNYTFILLYLERCE